MSKCFALSPRDSRTTRLFVKVKYLAIVSLGNGTIFGDRESRVGTGRSIRESDGRLCIKNCRPNASPLQISGDGRRGPRNRVFTEILRYNPQIRAKTRFLGLSIAANSLQSQEMHPARSIARYNCHSIRQNCTTLKSILSAETSNFFVAKQIPDFEGVIR